MVDMPRLLVVHHTPSPTMHSMLEAVLAGATDSSIEGVDVVTRAALAATAVDVLEADGFLIGTPANIGYMSGAMKHFFDQIYYPCLGEKVGSLYGVYVHGSSDTAAALHAVEVITVGLGWKPACKPVSVAGTLTASAAEECRELGATLAARLAVAI
ncbi:MAG: NAD(P)H-dependent oxidoreductase [Actinomycetota bacterium]|nr:NAD(P)H-dependent oxidoreductase [Actinomycetota bacterium]